jgi:hypothetical protein
MRSRKYSLLTRLTSLFILVALSCGHPAIIPAGTDARQAFAAVAGDIEASVTSSRNLIDRSSKEKCSSPSRPLFRPGYGNR